MITLTIDAGDGHYDRTIDPEELTLGFLEDLEAAQTSGKWRDLNAAIGGLLNLPHEAVRQITTRQFKQIAAALQDAQTVPNGSGANSA